MATRSTEPFSFQQLIILIDITINTGLKSINQSIKTYIAHLQNPYSEAFPKFWNAQWKEQPTA